MICGSKWATVKRSFGTTGVLPSYATIIDTRITKILGIYILSKIM